MNRGKWVSGAMTLIVIGVNVMAVGTDPGDLVMWLISVTGCTIMVATWLWMNRRRQRPAALVNTLDWRAMRHASRQLVRRRPWMWGPLGNLWVLDWHLMQPPYAVGPIYRWKARRDREIERSLSQCCGVPKGQRCPSHGGSDDVAR